MSEDRQSTSGETQWLKLTDAAKRLNVHPTTLRRWADEGQIPFMLTPGGHRRFAESDVAHMGQKRHTVRGMGPVERIWANQALERTRNKIMEQQSDSWLEHHDTEARDRNRDLGRQLMTLTMQYLTTEFEDHTLIDAAREIGRQYGQNAKVLGMPVTEALRASMFFRDTMVTAAVELPDNVRIPRESQVQMLDRINKILNTAQLGVAEAYSEETQVSK